MRGVDPQRNRKRETPLTVFHVKRSSTESRLLFPCVILTATQHEPCPPPGHSCRARVVHGYDPELGFIRNPRARPPQQTSGCTSLASAAGASATTGCVPLRVALQSAAARALGAIPSLAPAHDFCRSYRGPPLLGPRIPAPSRRPMTCHINELATVSRAGLRKLLTGIVTRSLVFETVHPTVYGHPATTRR